ncbi:MAG: fimbrillin family protein [Prevotella sp.]|nr:fimbrillin family protein [Prevotella sp.]
MYKLSNYVFVASALAVCLFAGCTSDDVGVNQPGKALTLNGGILENVEPVTMSSRGIMLTTAPQNPDSIIESEYTLSAETRTPVNDNNWAGIDGNRDIAVQVGDGNAPYKYSVDAAGKLTSENPYYITTANNFTVKSWYPYTSSAINSVGFTVQSDQSSITNLQKSDFLFGTSTTTNQGNAANSITYSHKTARVIVKVVVTNTNYMLNNGVVNSVKFTGAKLASSVSTSGDMTASGGTTTTVTMYKLSSSTSNNTTTAYYVAQIPPQSAKLSLTLDIGGVPYTANMSSAQTFTAGKGNELTVNVNSAKVYISSGNTIEVGDYYCTSTSGQAWVVKLVDMSSFNTNYGCVPIAVVFNTFTSTTDQNHGWKLGYALALQNSNGNEFCAWGPSGVDENLPNITGNRSTWTADGYTETMTIKNNSKQAFNATNYPAFYYAINYGVSFPATSSGWYLPSNMQWYYIVQNLTSLSKFTPTNNNGSTTWTTTDNAYSESFLELNNYLRSVTKYASYHEFLSGVHYWTSTEQSATRIYDVDASDTSAGLSSYSVWIDHGPKTKDRHYCRPVIAF